MEGPGQNVDPHSAIVEDLTGLEEVGSIQSSSSINHQNIPGRCTSVPTVPTIQSPSLELERRASEPTPRHPSIDLETGKWRPEHHWSAMYDMIYAKRCMAILTSWSPRKSKFVIIKEKQWIVDWATGQLTRVGPPDYREVEGNFEGGMGGS